MYTSLRLPKDRQTDRQTTEIIYHAASRVVKNVLFVVLSMNTTHTVQQSASRLSVRTAPSLNMLTFSPVLFLSQNGSD